MAKAVATKQCEFCGKAFEPVRDWQRFCSKECRWAEWDRAHPRVAKEAE